MTPARRPFVLSLLLAMVVASPPAAAQAFPSRPIRLIVADSAGGSPDPLGRLIAQGDVESLGQPASLKSAGAGGVLVAEIAAKSRRPMATHCS